MPAQPSHRRVFHTSKHPAPCAGPPQVLHPAARCSTETARYLSLHPVGSARATHPPHEKPAPNLSQASPEGWSHDRLPKQKPDSPQLQEPIFPPPTNVLCHLCLSKSPGPRAGTSQSAHPPLSRRDPLPFAPPKQPEPNCSPRNHLRPLEKVAQNSTSSFALHASKPAPALLGGSAPPSTRQYSRSGSHPHPSPSTNREKAPFPDLHSRALWRWPPPATAAGPKISHPK